MAVNESYEFVKNLFNSVIRVPLNSGIGRRPYLVENLAKETGKVSGCMITRTFETRPATYEASWLMRNAEIVAPRTGYVQSGDTAFWIDAGARRQYSKGFCADTVVEKVGVSSEQDSTGEADLLQPLWRRAVYAFFLEKDDPYFDFWEASHMINSGAAQSVAISRFCALGIRDNIAFTSFFYKNAFAGIVRNGALYATVSAIPLSLLMAKKWGVQIREFSEI
jgi:hypothetical protein